MGYLLRRAHRIAALVHGELDGSMEAIFGREGVTDIVVDVRTPSRATYREIDADYGDYACFGDYAEIPAVFGDQNCRLSIQSFHPFWCASSIVLTM